MEKVEDTIDLYKNSNEHVEGRVKDLLSRMTLREKVGQMTVIERSAATPSVIRDLSIGGVMSSPGSGPFRNPKPVDWAEMVDGFQRNALDSRLGIPLMYGIDAVHGNNSVYGATIFPHNVALGATRDADLARRIGEATALEVRATGIHCTFAPCVAVCKDSRTGSCYESYSEDTKIVKKMASIVSGLQGMPPQGHEKGYPFVKGRNNTIACAKYFVGDGGTQRDAYAGNTNTSYDEDWKTHVAPYLDCISQGVSIIMASYSSWHGGSLHDSCHDREEIPMHANHFALTEILKDKLSFKGIVLSAWDGVGRLGQPRGSNYRDCILKAINAGIDMVIVPYIYRNFANYLVDLVRNEEIPMSRIDDAVERILRVKFVAGLFEHPYSDRSLLDRVGCKLHRDLAREAVRKSLVLLKNGKEPTKPFLPLDKKAKRILVVGTHAHDLGYQCGGWTKSRTGGKGKITKGTTILGAINKAAAEKTDIIYEQNPSDDTLARKDISFAIVAVGEEPYSTVRDYNSDLVIPFKGSEVISKVADKFPTLVILVSGRPLTIESSVLEKIAALVAAWLPGSEGDGIADVIFGDYDFEGQLPVSWFKSAEQLPLNAESRPYDPLYPLGFRLKYSNEKDI